MRFLPHALLALALFLAVDPAQGRVLRVEVESREEVLDGKTFGPYGAYELLRGRIYFGFDPANPANDAIVDIERAPRNADGLVEAWATSSCCSPPIRKDAAE